MKIKKSSALFAPLIAAIIAWATPSAQAAVQVTQFDPALRISAWADPPTNSDLYNVLAADFNADGQADFRLAYEMGAMEAFFNAPTRFATRVSPPILGGGTHFILAGGLVAAVPLNSRIGTNIVSPGTNTFAWSTGFTNRYDLTQPLGDHEATVILANLVAPTLPGPIINFSSNGILVTNIYVFPTVTGDVVNREGVMAVEFNLNGELHYGYIHFDFRSAAAGNFGGTGGVIYGWAYETEPNVAIKAKPLSTSRTRVRQPKPPRTVVLPGYIPALGTGIKNN